MPRLQDEAAAENRRLLSDLDEIAVEVGASRAQLALAWLLARGSDVVPIAGMRRRSHLVANAAAASLELAPDAMARVDGLFASGAVAGERYPDYATAWLDHGTPEASSAP